MSKTLDSLNIPQGPIPPSPSVANVLREFHELDLPSSSVGMEPLNAEALDVLHRVEGYTDPLHLAGQLTSALRTLWVARKSGELPDEDGDATLWLLGEVSSLLEHAIEANHAATWWRGQHEKAVARAEQAKAKPATKRRARRQEVEA